MKYRNVKENAASNVTVNDLNLPAEFWSTPFKIHGISRFSLVGRELTSLVGCPNEIEHSLSVDNNALTSLIGAPNRIIGDFDCSANQKLTSLAGGPEYVRGDFYCANNKSIDSLVGSPKYVDGNFFIFDTSLTSLEGAPKTLFGNMYCNRSTGLTNLQNINKHISEMSGKFVMAYCPVVSHILGIFLIKGCRGITSEVCSVDFGKAIDIVNKYIKQGRAGLLPCQAELIAAGLDDYAQI